MQNMHPSFSDSSSHNLVCDFTNLSQTKFLMSKNSSLFSIIGGRGGPRRGRGGGSRGGGGFNQRQSFRGSRGFSGPRRGQ